MFCQPKVSIVVVNYKTYNLTIDCVETIKELDYPAFDIVIVDNNSPNSSYKVLSDRFSGKHKVIQSEENRGYAAGCNIGIEEAISENSKYVLILNNDLLIQDSNMLDILVYDCERIADCACMGPKVITKDGRMQGPLPRRNFTDYVGLEFFGGFAKKIGLKKESPVEKYKREATKEDVKKVYEISGACMLIDLDLLQTVGCFDENTFLYSEEKILSEKLRSIGKSCYFNSKTYVQHLASQTIQSSGRHPNNKYSRESFEYYLRNYRDFSLIELYCILGSTYLQNLILSIKERV